MSKPLTFGKAVIIGLGGTGQKALQQIKKNFQDSCGGKLPPCIKLLAFDTDQPDPALRDVHGNAVEFTANEFCRLSVASVREAIRSPYVQDWWISFPKIDNTAVTAGAGGIRQVGRLALFSCIDQVTKRIDTAYNEMNSYGSTEAMEKLGMTLLDQSPQVIVIGSLAGGTGGGLFFDMSILCRALGGATSKYMAFVMMPWVYRRIANTAYENTYAGLLELNQLSELTVERPARIRYSANLEAILEECPFHVINLVDGQCSNHERIEKPTDLVRFIAETVYHLTGAVGTKANSVYDNIIALRNTVNGNSQNEWGGKPALYSTIGVSTIRYPGSEWHQHFSYERSAELLIAQANELKRAGAIAITATNTSHPKVDSLVAQLSFHATKEGLLATLLPAAKRAAIMLENDDFESLETRQDVEQLIKEMTAKAQDQAAATLSTLAGELAKKTGADFANLVTSLPEEERATARQAFRAHLEVCRQKLTELSAAANVTSKELASELDRAFEQVPVELSLFHKLTGAFRSRSRNYARVADEQSQCTLHALAIRGALDLCADLTSQIDTNAQQLKTRLSETEKNIASLERLGAEFAAQSKSWLPGSQRSANRFEFVVGVDDAESGKAYYCFDKNDPIPEAAVLLKELPDSLQQAQIGLKGTSKYAEELLKWVRSRLIKIHQQTALDALRATMQGEAISNDERIRKAIKRALARSTLLLPLKNELLAQNEQFVKEHVVIGLGVSPSLPADQLARAWDGDKAAIEATIPSTDREWTQFSETTDPHLITVTRYKAIFPLHAIHGLHEMRHAYESRFLPPSHVDRRNLFVLSDPLPQNDTHPRALKVLTLAMLPSFNLIWQKGSGSGQGKYFAHSPELQHEFLTSYDIETRLPGAPGKFYSLVEELAKPPFAGLRREIERVLALKADEMTRDPARLAAFLADVELQRTRFQAMLENMIGGVRREHLEIAGMGRVKGQFNKTVTGQYYRRQADFLRRIMTGADLLRADIKSGKNPVEVLLDPSTGFKI